MSESTNTTNEDTPPAPEDNTPPPAQPTYEELLADRDKWKSMSRTNEDRWKEASKERDDLKSASMTDAEKALEQAKQEARNSALAEVGTRLVESELRTAAVTAGVQLPSFEFLNTSQFVDSNGLPDADRIKTFVESLPKPATGPEFSQDLGLGRQGGPVAGQLRRADLANMSHSEISKARSEGRLDSLMRGEL